MERESIRVTRSVVLPLWEIEIRVSRSSGPGGQHAQKSSTRVEALFDVEASDALTDTQKKRVVGRAGPVLQLAWLASAETLARGIVPTNRVDAPAVSPVNVTFEPPPG